MEEILHEQRCVGWAVGGLSYPLLRKAGLQGSLFSLCIMPEGSQHFQSFCCVLSELSIVLLL